MLDPFFMTVSNQDLKILYCGASELCNVMHDQDDTLLHIINYKSSGAGFRIYNLFMLDGM